ncbi:hypothetical protein [Rhodococcus sp. RDE2]|uniref:hypothetical protein n=1 Tax=Rhodococcus sp. RDE2 TaxID=2885078 RepID=UPI001E47CBC1|nr:hypothetical protein [Rhodococcus sp. RDE2]BDB61385.1 hypothetical protein RDE2_31790 [Rhodococcus sp. RDE2]
MTDAQETITALRRTLIAKEREAAELVDRVAELTAQLSARPISPPQGAPVGRDLPSDDRLITVEDALVLQEVGLYEYHHPLRFSHQESTHESCVESGAGAVLRTWGPDW